MSQTSRTSGELTESSGTSGSVAVATGPVKLNSVHGYVVSGSSAQCVIYDNTAASGKVVARMFIDSQDPGGVPQTSKSMEYDMHGVIALNGLYYELTSTGAGGAGLATVAVSVEFA